MRIALAIVLALATSVSAWAQTWDRNGGSMQTRGSTTTPLVIIDQVGTGKILSLRDDGVERCSVNVDGNLVCVGTLTLTGQMLLGDGTAAAPSLAPSGDPNTGLLFDSVSTGIIDASGNGTTRVRLVDSTGARYALTLGASTDLSWGSSGVLTPDVSLSRLAADVVAVAAGDAWGLASKAWIRTAPTVPVACTTPTVVNSNGTAAFEIDVGSTCAGVTTLVVTMPAVTNSYHCTAINLTTGTMAPEMTAATSTSITITNFQRTTGLAADWADGANVSIGCTGR